MKAAAGSAEKGESTMGVSPGRGFIEANDLRIAFASDEGYSEVIRGVSLAVDAGESVGLVGESGSGKSVTCKALLGLIEPGGELVQGDVLWRGQSLLRDNSRAHLSAVRGSELASIPQDPMMALDPVFTVGYQIEEVCRFVKGMSRKQAQRRAIELLDMVGVPSPGQRLRQYPHEFSGGMQQRVLIAMALAAEPALLIADEPTTALDVTVQSQILGLLRDLKDELALSLLLVTHDLGVVAEVCDRVLVMYAGRIVEQGTCDQIFNRPTHPYTRGILASTPRIDVGRQDRLYTIPGVPPSPYQRPEGCPFRPRCPISEDRCREEPELLDVANRRVACWNWEEGL